jgi:uncharacterized Zn-binding protein involved in type VI secretion
MSDSHFAEDLVELLDEAKAGKLARREFLRRAMLLGLSAGTTSTLLSTIFAPLARAATPSTATAPEPSSPTRAPVIAVAAPRAAPKQYQWGTQQAAEGAKGVYFWLRSPFEGSPKILTKGWQMEAHVRVNLPEVSGDFSPSIRWSGSGTFSNETGPLSTPTFSEPGLNIVRLSLRIKDRDYLSTFSFYAKDASRYARLGSMAQCPLDAHGCPACPHSVVGPLIQGSPNYTIDGIPVARVGDKGVHQACCGPNTYSVVAGDPEILINGKQVPRIGDRTRHCGGDGKLI